MGAVEQNLAKVSQAVARAAKAAGRDPGSVTLVAVSKTKPADMIRQAMAAGQADFGENYAQELRDKTKELGDAGIRWHFIGHLQKNKARYVAGKVYEVHSLDSLELAKELDRRAGGQGAIQRVLVEVNLGGEASKSGVEQEQAAGLIRAAMQMPNLQVVGLMTMPPYLPDPEDERPFYRRLRELREELRKELGDGEALPELSMGLSHDFEVAIQEGATRVRVGTAIFGERNYA